MSEQDRCPKCGVESSFVVSTTDGEYYGPTRYGCETIVYGDGEVMESQQCMQNQLTTLRADNARLQVQLQRYEAVVGAAVQLHDALTVYAGDRDAYTEARDKLVAAVHAQLYGPADLEVGK